MMTNDHKVFCLLSGGVDSSTTLAIAKAEFPEAEFEAITIDYGQRHRKEAECAAKQAANYGAKHVVIDAKGFMSGMLVDKGVHNEAIPEVSYSELAHGISPTYVSFRNGLMLSILAARAQAWVMEQEKSHDGILMPAYQATIYIGVHADDGVNWAYPDCTPEFIGHMSAAIFVGTYYKVRVRAPLLYLTKPQVVMEGVRKGVDYSNTWSCYVGAEKHCGICPTCRSRKDAFIDNGVYDPTEYAQ